MKTIKCLYIDIISPKEHLNYNNGILRNLPDHIILDVCGREKYFKKDVIKFRKYYQIPPELIYVFKQGRKFTQIVMRIKMFLAFEWVYRNIDMNSYDAVIWASIDEIVFSLVCRKSRSRVLFIDHLIGNIVSGRVKRFFFQRIRSEYEFIAFEDYIAEYLKKNVGEKRKTWVVRHPLPEIDREVIPCAKLDYTLVFAPALSNDEEFIDFLIREEEKIPDKVKIRIRSTEKEYMSEKLEVYSLPIPEREYYSGIASSSLVLIHYGESYNYRTSGVLYEAVQLKRPVFLYCGNTLNHYRKKYPEILFPFFRTEGFFEELRTALVRAEQVCDKDFDEILEDYSDKRIAAELKHIFEA